jgi:hypothetical protein
MERSSKSIKHFALFHRWHSNSLSPCRRTVVPLRFMVEVVSKLMAVVPDVSAAFVVLSMTLASENT